MNDNLCYGAKYCRNRKIMCELCKFQDKYRPKLNRTVANTILILAREYLSKVKCCDECFCECWCILNDVKQSRIPHKGCEYNIINSIRFKNTTSKNIF